jgi:phosphogluconate dehydratase
MPTKDIHPVVTAVLENIKRRSQSSRDKYLKKVDQMLAMDTGVNGGCMSCGNIAHAFAASSDLDKTRQIDKARSNIAIVTAYNDMLSAHQPYQDYPKKIRDKARSLGATAQVASGVPAMCDGITQGQAGMEMSLFSRDVIAMSASVGLSHNVFDASVFLGICDKIVPGLAISAATFGHLPCVFIPSGPMKSGISNSEKNSVREQFALGKVGKETLLSTEMKSYHSAGTCTFYGTANTNQMIVELMGLQLPGSSFINPDSPLRDKMTDRAIERVIAMSRSGSKEFLPAKDIFAIPNFVNAIVGLLATGGSTNLLLHLVVMARAAGIQLAWDDFDQLSKAVPLLCRVYPNGEADINEFESAGGLRAVIGGLLEGGYLVEDVVTVSGAGLQAYTDTASLDEDGELQWSHESMVIHDDKVIRPVDNAFQDNGGIQLMTGNLGRAIVKSSALKNPKAIFSAPAKVFTDQDQVKKAFQNGELDCDFICVVKFQGPKSNGMPELHGLTPILGAVQNKGFKVAILTDGRMSGASGKVPALIHACPEAADQGPINDICTGDVIEINLQDGQFNLVETVSNRSPLPESVQPLNLGRELFDVFRSNVSSAEQGATVLRFD